MSRTIFGDLSQLPLVTLACSALLACGGDPQPLGSVLPAGATVGNTSGGDVASSVTATTGGTGTGVGGGAASVGSVGGANASATGDVGVGGSGTLGGTTGTNAGLGTANATGVGGMGTTDAVGASTTGDGSGTTGGTGASTVGGPATSGTTATSTSGQTEGVGGAGSSSSTASATTTGGSSAASTGCGVAGSPASGTYPLDVNGLSREFNISLPQDYDPNTPYRLVFAWHWLTGTAARVQSAGYYGLASRSAGTTIFVAGQGLDNNGDGEYGWPDSNGRDVAFARALLDWVLTRYCIDQERIFSTGWSYGGMFSNRLGCVMGDVFRAIAPMSGNGPRGGQCVGQVAAWIAHGDQDGTVSLSSGQGSRDYWLNANHCSTESAPTEPGTCVAYQGCDAGLPVHWCQFSGGHTQPSFASEGIWNFFSQF